MDKPTKEEAARAVHILNDIMIFVAQRGLWNTPDADVMKLMNWIQHECGYSDLEVGKVRILTNESNIP